jgi:hypothetical protein
VAVAPDPVVVSVDQAPATTDPSENRRTSAVDVPACAAPAVASNIAVAHDATISLFTILGLLSLDGTEMVRRRPWADLARMLRGCGAGTGSP